MPKGSPSAAKRAEAAALFSLGLKICSKCGILKPTVAFYAKGRASASPTCTLFAECKTCTGKYQSALHQRKKHDPEYRARRRGHNRAWRRRNPDYGSRTYDPAARRRELLWRKYRLTLDAYDAMLAAQGGRCGICPTTEPGGRSGVFHVDHDHACCPGGRSCGQCVRALLCTKCNTMLGLADDDPLRLMKAAEYVRSFQTC